MFKKVLSLMLLTGAVTLTLLNLGNAQTPVAPQRT